MHLKISSEKYRPFCLGINVLNMTTAVHAESRKHIEGVHTISNKIYVVMKCEMNNGKNIVVEQNAYKIEYVSWLIFVLD